MHPKWKFAQADYATSWQAFPNNANCICSAHSVVPVIVTKVTLSSDAYSLAINFQTRKMLGGLINSRVLGCASFHLCASFPQHCSPDKHLDVLWTHSLQIIWFPFLFKHVWKWVCCSLEIISKYSIFSYIIYLSIYQSILILAS